MILSGLLNTSVKQGNGGGKGGLSQRREKELLKHVENK